MRKIKTVYSFLAFIICVLSVFCSCLHYGNNDVPAVSGTMQDQLGRAVKMPEATRRIISLAPSNTEILFALGLEDRISAVTDYCDYPPEAKSKPSVGGFSNPNLEEIIALQPDLILATSMHEQTIIPQLERRGLVVFALNPGALDEVCEAVTMVGELTERKNYARDIVKDIQNRASEVQSKVAEIKQQELPEVFYAVWHDPLMAAGKCTFQNELIATAGGVNIASGLDGYADISLEYLINADPEVIIVNTSHGSNVNETLIFLQSEPRMNASSARLHNRIYEIDGNISSRPGPRLMEGLERFVLFIHPELFD